MCLQWCYVNAFILNNDHACRTCPLAVRPDSHRQCHHCTHRRTRWIGYLTHPPDQPVTTPLITVTGDDGRSLPVDIHVAHPSPTTTVIRLAWSGQESPAPDRYTIRMHQPHPDWISVPPATVSESDWTWVVAWDHAAYCHATRTVIPPPGPDRGCCHANADIRDQVIPLTRVAIAPWEPYRDAEPMLAEWMGTVPAAIDTSTFARPVRFGVPSTAWDDQRPESESLHGILPPTLIPRLIDLIMTLYREPAPNRTQIRTDYHDVLAAITALRAARAFHDGDAELIWNVLRWMDIVTETA